MSRTNYASFFQIGHEAEQVGEINSIVSAIRGDHCVYFIPDFFTGLTYRAYMAGNSDLINVTPLLYSLIGLPDFDKLPVNDYSRLFITPYEAGTFNPDIFLDLSILLSIYLYQDPEQVVPFVASLSLGAVDFLK